MAELAEILLGCDIIRVKQIVSNISLKSPDELCNKSMLKSLHMIKFCRGGLHMVLTVNLHVFIEILGNNESNVRF